MPRPTPDTRPRRRARMVLATCALATSLALGTGGAAAAFIEGPPAVAVGPVQFGPTTLNVPVSSHTAAFEDIARLPTGQPERPPRVGDVVYLRARVQRLNGSQPIVVTVVAPPDGAFAISQQDQVGCGYATTSPPGGGFGPCPVQAASGSAYVSGALPFPPGMTRTIFVPIRVSAQKTGQADGDAAKFTVVVQHLPGGVAAAIQWITVAPQPAPAPAPTPTPTPTPPTTTPGTTGPAGTSAPGGQTAGTTAAPTSGRPVCNPLPARAEGAKGRIRLSRQALVIQQRIDAAALRRLNAANAWIDTGIVPTDLCAGSFGQGAFVAGVPWAGGGTVQASAPPTPRALSIADQDKAPGTFSVDLRQIRINDRISRALLARAQATTTRIASLTGGNLAPGARLSGRTLYPGLTISGALPGAGDQPAAPLTIGALEPEGALRVGVAQLERTQQRSQRAIVLANAVNDRIAAGLTEANFRPGSIGAGRLAP